MAKQPETRIVLEKPNQRSGVYVLLNPFEKRAYVGETMDFYRRLPEHILSIFGQLDASNHRMMNARTKVFDAFTVIHVDYVKNRNGDPSESLRQNAKSEWIVDETAVMYVLRRCGFSLYNGKRIDKNGREMFVDNLGTQRSFLMEENTDPNKLKELTIEYLSDSTIPAFETADNAPPTWDSVFDCIENELNMQFSARYDVSGIADLAQADHAVVLEKWNARLERVRHDDRCVLIGSEKEAQAEMKKMMGEALSADDLDSLGITCMSVEAFCDLIDQGAFDRTAVSKFGHYLD